MSNPMKEWLEEMGYEEEQSEAKGMCPFCDYESSRNTIFQDGLTGDWYLDIQTNEWDNEGCEYVHQREFINFCPFCGRELK